MRGIYIDVTLHSGNSQKETIDLIVSNIPTFTCGIIAVMKHCMTIVNAVLRGRSEINTVRVWISVSHCQIWPHHAIFD